MKGGSIKTAHIYNPPRKERYHIHLLYVEVYQTFRYRWKPLRFPMSAAFLTTTQQSYEKFLNYVHVRAVFLKKVSESMGVSHIPACKDNEKNLNGKRPSSPSFKKNMECPTIQWAKLHIMSFQRKEIDIYAATTNRVNHTMLIRLFP